jgi:hypothetical protein
MRTEHVYRDGVCVYCGKAKFKYEELLTLGSGWVETYLQSITSGEPSEVLCDLLFECRKKLLEYKEEDMKECLRTERTFRRIRSVRKKIKEVADCGDCKKKQTIECIRCSRNGNMKSMDLYDPIDKS